MNILAFSINPIFSDRVTGGASKHLNRVLRHLAEQGNQITLLCAAVAAQPLTFELSPNILVKAVLPFHLPFPQPYAISPFELTRISRIIQSELEGKDRFYIHDGELLLPGIYSQVPTITSFRDNVYPESVLGTFIGQADEIICVSPYSADVIRYSAGSVLKGLNERIHVVLNGIDLEVFHPADPASITEFLGLDPSNRFLLHPHRPELSKGLKNTLDILEILVKRFGHQDLVLLSPNWLPEMAGELENLFKRDILAYIDRLGLTNQVIFHKWLKQEQLASYYSLGSVTFSVGSNPEAFGNVAYESLACGTPSVVARVGTHRTLLPDGLIYKTEYDNPDLAAAICDNILQNSIRVTQSNQLNVSSILNIEKQLIRYADIILHANKRKPMQMTTHMMGGGIDYQLAPWCDLTPRGIFNDYRGKYLTELDCKGITELINLLKQSKRITPDKISQEKINQLVDLGVIVPNLI